MNCGEDDSPPYITSYRNGPYSSSVASSASSSTASIWSDASSQSSDDSSAPDTDLPESYCLTSSQPAPSFTTTNEQVISVATYWAKHKTNFEVAQEQRENPRRTSVTARSGPPSLVRQCDRKVSFVDSLVDSSAQIVEAIWPLSSVACRSDMGNKGVLPLRTFIQETLRRSRTSYSTLQVALYYLILIKPHVPKHDFTMEQPDDAHSIRALQCGRRMFLAALILASKYLQDRNYSARAWSKISGLNTLEINQNEMAFLLAVNWELHITEPVFQRWADIVLKYTPSLSHLRVPAVREDSLNNQQTGSQSFLDSTPSWITLMVSYHRHLQRQMSNLLAQPAHVLSCLWLPIATRLDMVQMNLPRRQNTTHPVSWNHHHPLSTLPASLRQPLVSSPHQD